MIVLEWLFLTIAPCDAAEPWQLGSQDAATPMMQGIIDLHHDIFLFLLLILVFVSWILVRALWHFHYKKNPIPQRIVHGTTIEILRTIFPSIIPMFIAIPSFALLYSMDEVVVDPAITIKAIGHQWYRTYEYSDYNSSDEQSLTFDSYTIPEDDPELGQSRLLEVDNRVVVPANTHLRLLVTSADVPHSWALPSLGVKCDALPGRLNQISISLQREGVYYGQCSEICGTNHAFMPIVVEAVYQKDYVSRVFTKLLWPYPEHSENPIYEGIPVPADRLEEALSSPFYISSTVHIPGEIQDPLTLDRLSKLNRLLRFLSEHIFHEIRPAYTRSLQLELDQTEEGSLSAKLEEIRRRELTRFRLSEKSRKLREDSFLGGPLPR
uniref:cytochrome c oxidase subunit 2 n=1 Tax=Cuscuta japonica TaxID=81913 RepID=UPI001EDEF3A6|nr:cytochrome c oxidase subunit 2 [Cuscuta japonica]UJP67948.1 cytochrome c oxidase subunit 2 [Cuscuta japonica]